MTMPPRYLNRIILAVTIALCGLAGRALWAQSSLLADVQVERGKYQAPLSPEQLAAMLNAVAWKNRGEWGLLRKDSGNNCPHASGVKVACDILMHRPTARIYDVLKDAEGSAGPTWGEAGGSPTDPSRFVAPVDVGGGGTTPPPPPPPPCTDLARELVLLRQAIEQLDERIIALREEVAVGTNAAGRAAANTDALKAQVEELKTRPIPWPVYEGSARLIGRFTLTPKQ